MTAITASRETNRGRAAGTSRLGRGGPMTYLVAIFFVGICIAPVLFIIIGGFRTNSQITTDPSGLPDPWVMRNYVDVLVHSVFWRQIANSTIAAVGTTAGVVVLGGMGSSRLNSSHVAISYAVFCLKKKNKKT